ncbi:PREDICTED: uncharacterized protein LOC108378981 [Rhagoletis zephyria]|uniref:uncharacterized protein LOC108378981 n=1 Tax=Rhagoletis zephyria TaxID=28612 RepID=UPI000811554E|nr:PREDICTED: uncharacterized protein LOC108378981 [Rhagoletis zephyria]
MDWRHTEILKLLDSYRQYECLWNTQSPDYKQQEMRKGSWIALSKEFGKKVDDIKKKIKHLRTCYMAEKKKVESRTDSNGDPIYESHLYYYKQMSFLDPVIIKKPPQPTMSNRVVLNQKRGRSVSTDSEKEEPQRELRTSITRLDSTNPAFRATLRFNPIQTAKYGLHQQKVRSLSPDSEKEETQQELNTSISRLDSTNSPKAHPRFISKSTVRRTNDVPKTQPPKKIVKHLILSKEDTFCAMLCSELKLLKSEETYDNVTSDIFAAVRSAKIAERQMELERL